MKSLIKFTKYDIQNHKVNTIVKRFDCKHPPKTEQ
jgi:hypothetical protein